MNKNILIINGKKSFGHSLGSLNQHLADTAEKHLISLGYSIQTTIVDDGYNADDEIQKWLIADTIIYQMPAWWMGPPWIIKNYIDEVFTLGHGKLYMSDGRSRSDITKQYGSGGLLKNKKYLLSVTWNAPPEAFTEQDQLFEGVGVDGVYLHFHKAHEFLAMSRLPTFMCNDVIKNPNIDSNTIRYKNHLNDIFKA